MRGKVMTAGLTVDIILELDWIYVADTNYVEG